MVYTSNQRGRTRLYLVQTSAGSQYTWLTPSSSAQRLRSSESMLRSLPERPIELLLRDLSVRYESACYPGLPFGELAAALKDVQSELTVLQRGLWALNQRERRVLHGKA